MYRWTTVMSSTGERNLMRHFLLKANFFLLEGKRKMVILRDAFKGIWSNVNTHQVTYKYLSWKIHGCFSFLVWHFTAASISVTKTVHHTYKGSFWPILLIHQSMTDILWKFHWRFRMTLRLRPFEHPHQARRLILTHSNKMLISIVGPGSGRSTLVEESIISDGLARHESFSSLSFHQGLTMQIVW